MIEVKEIVNLIFLVIDGNYHFYRRKDISKKMPPEYLIDMDKWINDNKKNMKLINCYENINDRFELKITRIIAGNYIKWNEWSNQYSDDNLYLLISVELKDKLRDRSHKKQLRLKTNYSADYLDHGWTSMTKAYLIGDIKDILFKYIKDTIKEFPYDCFEVRNSLRLCEIDINSIIDRRK